MSGDAPETREASSGPEPSRKGPFWRPLRGGIRRLRLVGAVLVGLSVVAVAGAASLLWLDRAYPPRLSPADPPSTIVVANDGQLLRAFTTREGRWRLPVALVDIDPLYLKMLVAYEDRRFREHAGIDLLAVLRASGQMAAAGHVVSGASTLTMQTARLVEGRPERTLARKLDEMARAVQLERRLSKDEILALYLSLAPFGGNIEGVRAASLAYFGREPNRLTPAQAALLVALPQSPETRRPDRFPKVARAARDRVLDRMVSLSVIPPEIAAEAKTEAVPEARIAFPRLAPHAAEAALAAHPERAVHRLTLDRDLQASLESLVAARVPLFGPRVSGAAVVVENATGRILAEVGSAGYLDDGRAGHVDMTSALRSPGSALKPFIYGLAFEAGIAHPETLVEDRPTAFGNYNPKNFDDGFQGTVTARQALQMSLNVPAVALLEAVGPARLAARLADVGVDLKLPRGEAPNLAVGLGGVGIRLIDLAALYAGLADRGVVPELVIDADAPPPPEAGLPRRLLSPVAAWYVADVLSGTPPPDNGRAGRIAFKTGTSYGYRDAWAIGFDGRHTVAVWVGRPDGAAVPGLVARSSAAPILFEAFARLSERRAPLPGAPADALLATTATLPPPLRGFGAAAETPAVLASARRTLRIAYPPDGARVVLDDLGGRRQQLAWSVEGTSSPLTLFLDGRPISVPTHSRTGSIDVPARGFVRLTAVDAGGAADSVTVFVE
ncbi:penicillin-binding protein 1C [Pseudoxanthobacter soli DSM 19599]|uniref:peptidoglycan glycosyltransferase n=1 Tax=Pseudoxanthobacter soli DSM 19599 TaxID=1123029 RepID=A0A1M7Z7K0_9HYPH|nr:penicillin-binding protein 1C [Pseudoxanthobacter soli]SHO60907.1 penicillin-binding protein 1C [Pseudoxanthobacter soli DSM 19599]